MRRLTRGRAATADEATPQAYAASEPVSVAPDDAQQGGGGVPANGSIDAAQSPAEQRTSVHTGGDEATATGEAAKPDATGGAAKPDATGEAAKTDATAVAKPDDSERAGRDLPAGVDPAKLDGPPGSARRGRLRRRLRYLRAVREVLLRDLGGFYYEAQRTDEGPEAHRRLLDAKAARLGRLDDEIRELESHLQEERPQTTFLRQPGLGGTCPQCGDLHGSDARFCSRCGTPLGRRPSAPRPTSVPATTAAGDEPKATTASLWGRPKRRDPATSDPTVAGPEATLAAEPAPRGADEPAGGDEPRAGEAPGEDHARAGEAADERRADEAGASGTTDEPAPTGSERS